MERDAFSLGDMHIFFLLLFLICIFVFLFTLYVLGREDFIILRKNVSMEQLFNLSFLTLIAGLFAARIFYTLLNFDTNFFQPLTFFLFFYFPGLSLTGGLLGGAFFTLGYSYLKKLPSKRIFDIFSLSFLATLPIGFIITFIFQILSHKSFSLFNLLIPLVYIVFFVILVRIFTGGKLKDGSTGFFSLASFSLISLASSILGKVRVGFSLRIEDIILITILLISLAFYIYQQKLFFRKK